MIKPKFLASLLQSHDPSEIILIFWFPAEKKRLLLWIESLEEQHLSEIKIFCKIINVFITFDRFKASLLNKSINFYNENQKYIYNNYTDSKLLNGIVYNVTKSFYFR